MKRFFCQSIEVDEEKKCRHCGQIAKYVDVKYRPECGSCHNDPELHAPICCNANMQERLPEFVACAFRRPLSPHGMHLCIHAVKWGSSSAAKERLRNKIVEEMLIPVNADEYKHVPGKIQLLAYKHKGNYGREEIDVQRTVHAKRTNHFIMNFDLLDSVRCTKHSDYKLSRKYHYAETKKHWEELPESQLEIPYVKGTARLKSGKNILVFKTGIVPEHRDVTKLEDEKLYTAVTLRPASLKSMCLGAINKDRIEYQPEDIPEKDMLPLLWKAHSPNCSEEIDQFLFALTDGDQQNRDLRAKKKQKNEEGGQV